MRFFFGTLTRPGRGVTDGEQIEGGGPGPKPGSIAFYAALYDASERTVKRWNRTGVDAGDATPLADPEKMRAWWSRNMTQREPDGISAAVIRWRRENGTPAQASAPAAVPADELPLQPVEKNAARKAMMDVPVDDDEIGPEQTLRRLLELEPKLHRLATEPGQAKDYLSTVARIGPAAERLRVENERQRKLISKD